VRFVVDGVSKTYAGKGGPVHSLDRVGFTVGDREFVVLVGPSGCGKSTLLGIVAGLLAPTAGQVYLEGVEAAGPSAVPPIAMVFQEVALFPWRTVLGNAAFGLEERGVPRREREEVARRQLRAVGLSGFEDAYPHQLSGGMRQRVGIARALAVQPRLLLMDEPFSALDAQTRLLLQEELTRIWQETDLSVLYVTHNIPEAVYFADRVVVLSRRPGRVTATVPVDLPRPRSPLGGDPAFAALCDRIWGLIRRDAEEALNEP
jgi:NitT/TauT family transport system ATP-binding protein